MLTETEQHNLEVLHAVLGLSGAGDAMRESAAKLVKAVVIREVMRGEPVPAQPDWMRRLPFNFQKSERIYLGVRRRRLLRGQATHSLRGRFAGNQRACRARRLSAYRCDILILVSIATLSIDTLPDLEPATRRWLGLSEAIITILFTLEYILRTATTRPPWRYICSFYGIVDLLAIVSFYLAAGVDLRSLRIVRIFRVFRTLKILRYGITINRFGKALRLTQQELALFMLATAMLLYISAVGIYYLEHEAEPGSLRLHHLRPLVGGRHAHDGRVRRCLPRNRRWQVLHRYSSGSRHGSRRGAGGLDRDRTDQGQDGRRRASDEGRAN